MRSIADRTVDLLVIGGGIIGAGIARDAALRGLSVALVEQADFASGTTSRPTRLIHGGLRYLELFDFGLVRSDMREREILLRIAPHLVFPLPFLLPLYRPSLVYQFKLRLGMQLYDWLSLDKSLPKRKYLDRAATLAAEPNLKPDGLTGAWRFYDAQVPLVERLVVENVVDAAAHGALVLNHAGDPDDVLATDGRTMVGADMRIVRLDGEVAAPDEEGEIQVRGDMLFLGYLDEGLDADALTADHWLRTGDLGRMDAQGQLTVTGRLKDVIIRKGENISAKEVEDVLVHHREVRDVAVIGLPDDERGERCCAVIVPVTPRRPPTLADLVEHCIAAGLMRQKIPEQLEVLDALPYNSTGKVLKADLRKRYT